MDDNLPPLPEPTLESHEYELWGQNVLGDFFTAAQVIAIQREAYEAGKRAAIAPHPPQAKPVVGDGHSLLTRVLMERKAKSAAPQPLQAEDAKDAERYRKLRNNDMTELYCSWIDEMLCIPDADAAEFDAAIDAAKGSA